MSLWRLTLILVLPFIAGWLLIGTDLVAELAARLLE